MPSAPKTAGTGFRPHRGVIYYGVKKVVRASQLCAGTLRDTIKSLVYDCGELRPIAAIYLTGHSIIKVARNDDPSWRLDYAGIRPINYRAVIVLYPILK